MKNCIKFLSAQRNLWRNGKLNNVSAVKILTQRDLWRNGKSNNVSIVEITQLVFFLYEDWFIRGKSF